MNDLDHGAGRDELPSDEELEALAMGAGLEEIDGGLPPLHHESVAEALLPTWYMPAPAARLSGSWRRRILIGLVLTLLAIELAGLCSTYGPIG